MPLKKDFFRQVMGHFTTGVTVVTTQSQSKLAGITISSFASLSLEPLLVLICVDQASRILPLFRESKCFAVNILTAEQTDLSRHFALPLNDRYDQFAHIPYHIRATGCPLLDDTLAFVDTRLVAEYPGGDHAILVGQVEAMGIGKSVVFANQEDEDHQMLRDLPDVAPLAYFRGQYRSLGCA